MFQQEPDIEGIIHFAAYKTVPESVAKPLLYYRNNLESLINLLECVRQRQTPYFIFSSSCSVYGNIKEQPVTEQTPLERAESPYGRTKQMGEEIINDLTKIYQDTSFIMLRYFNPAGAHESALLGELPMGTPNNLVPYITQTAIGLRDKLRVFGTDYATPDGTCLRDYIHVMDIADAHTKSLQYLMQKRNAVNPEVFNLGTGAGISVLEVVKAFEDTNGLKLNYELAPRRPGDVAAIYANNEKAAKKLGWKPARSLNEMMRSAWEWEKKLAREKV
jgi:UDP-glucose 4-epimerase